MECAIVAVILKVLGSQEGVFRLTDGAMTCACVRGSVVKAVWTYDGQDMEFKNVVRTRWKTKGRLDKVDIDINQTLWDDWSGVLFIAMRSSSRKGNG